MYKSKWNDLNNVITSIESVANRLWKKKLPAREEKAYKERIKVESGVFDREVLLGIDSLLKKKVIDSIDYCISTGKEADVFRGSSKKGFFAIKIFRTFTSEFNRYREYWDDEMQIKTKKEKEIRSMWCAKEYRNLEKISDLGFAPKPIYHLKNINVLEFLGQNGLPYPQITKCKEMLSENEYLAVLEYIQKMYERDLIHADLSEYNMLFDGKKIYLIDFAQGVKRDFEKAQELLTRDIENVNKFFGKLNIKTTKTEEILKEIVKK